MGAVIIIFGLIVLFLGGGLFWALKKDKNAGRHGLTNSHSAKRGSEIVDVKPVLLGRKQYKHYDVIIYFADGTSYQAYCTKQRGMMIEFDQDNLPNIIEDAIEKHERIALMNEDERREHEGNYNYDSDFNEFLVRKDGIYLNGKIYHPKSLEELKSELNQYISKNYVTTGNHSSQVRFSLEPDYSRDWGNGGNSFFKVKEKTFSEKLIDLIDSKRLRDTEVYKAAHIDRRLFSKIQTDKLYKPSKDTCLCFAFALNLSKEEALTLLKSAGFTLSKSIKRDLVMEYCFINNIFDIDKINELLIGVNEKTL